MLQIELEDEGLSVPALESATLAGGDADFAPLAEIAEAERFAAVVARLEAAGIPWYVESIGTAAVVYVGAAWIGEAQKLAGEGRRATQAPKH
jgi:hypothetical protein